MRYVKEISGNQIWLLPHSIEEFIEKDNPIRVIEAYVDSLSAEELGLYHAVPERTGRPAFNPCTLLKLYIYGYMNRIRSSRRLMAECRRNVELFYLLGMVKPDFRTIARFRKENRKVLENVFKDFVQVCTEVNLLGKQTFAVDGTKIRAVNSKKRSFTPELLEKKLAYLQNQSEQIEQYLSQMDELDANEYLPELDIKPHELQKKLGEVRERVAKYKSYKKRMQESGEKQILETDPECRTLHTKEGLLPAYNIQTVVDAKQHIIAAFETTNANTDSGLLNHMAEKTKKELHIETAEFLADKGFESRADIEQCLLHGNMPNVGLKYDKEERLYDLEYIPAEIDEATRRSTRPEDISKCLHAGVLPRCYEGNNLSVRIQSRGQISCFIKHDDGRVTCPTGKELFFRQNRQYGAVYGSREACRTCKSRCTDSMNPKEVQIGFHSIYVPVYMFGTPETPLQKIPDVQQDTPYNHFGRRKQHKARVQLSLRRDPKKMQLRKELVEHPFGTIKWYDGAHYFLCKGKEMVTAEIALSFLTYNLRRAINVLGVGALVAHLNERKQKNRG